MGKAIRVEDVKLLSALQDGADGVVLIAGNRRFILVEVKEKRQGEAYNVTDPEEVRLLRVALADTSPLLTDEEADQYLEAQLKEHGVS